LQRPLRLVAMAAYRPVDVAAMYLLVVCMAIAIAVGFILSLFIIWLGLEQGEPILTVSGIGLLLAILWLPVAYLWDRRKEQ